MDSFSNYIQEAAQQGFRYEVNAATALKVFGIVPKSFVPAGAGHDQPDLMIQKDGVQAGCELKITAASAGSLVLKYNSGKWSIGNPNETDEEKLFIMDLAKEVGIIDQINRVWDSEPIKGTGQSQKLNAEASKLSKREKYQRDLGLFKDIKGSIPASKIEDYYNKKKTYYVNVGTHGFYLLGPKNPLNLTGIPRFGSSASATYRARVQYKGKDNYQFTFEMQFSIPANKKSPHNIAPVKSKTDVSISNLDLEWFIK
jgi:hypothetical protein